MLYTQIEDAYTSVGFAVFTNALDTQDQTDMNCWFDEMKSFFELDQETKNKYPYEGDTNLGYSIVGDENVDPTAPKDMKESFNYNNQRMPDHLWPTELNGFKATALQSITIADKLTLSILSMFDEILKCGYYFSRYSYETFQYNQSYSLSSLYRSSRRQANAYWRAQRLWYNYAFMAD